MTVSLRNLFISLILGMLPLAAQAQGVGQNTQTGTGVGSTSTGAASPSTGVVPPSIGNATLQRQQRTGQPGGQIIDPRTGQPIDARTQQLLQPEIQPPLERIEFQDFVAQSTGRDLPIFGSDLFKNVPSSSPRATRS